jgi:hypothetical protein
MAEFVLVHTLMSFVATEVARLQLAAAIMAGSDIDAEYSELCGG